jgi:hypothetical protein
MSRYVILHKLSRGFDEWRFHGNYDPSLRSVTPMMTPEFVDWYHENIDQIKKIHKEKMVELDKTLVALEFHNEEDALLCMLKFG